MKHIISLVLISFLLQGCAGTRYSYKSHLQKEGDASVLRVQKGDSIELLAVGKGFPGQWGYFPWVISSSPDIARVDCKEARSVVPFREPGILLGGEVCRLTAQKAGKLMLYFGNKYNLSKDNYQDSVGVIVVESESALLETYPTL